MAEKKIVDGQEDNFLVDQCDNCGFTSYSVVARCPVCGNMILVSDKITKRDWIKGRVREKLDERKRKDSQMP